MLQNDAVTIIKSLTSLYPKILLPEYSRLYTVENMSLTQQ